MLNLRLLNLTILEVKLKYLLTLLLVVTLVTLTFLDFKKETDKPLTIQGSIMGTTYKVITYGENNSISKEKIHDIFSGVNKEMSTYLNDSLICLLYTSDAADE